MLLLRKDWRSQGKVEGNHGHRYGKSAKVVAHRRRCGERGLVEE